MAIVLADSGAAAFLRAYFNNVWPAGGKNLTLRLFTNNYTPLDTSTASNFTEAVGGGYTAKALTNASWTESNVAGIEQAAYALQTWTFTGALSGNATVYGYYVTDADGVLIYAEAQAPYQPANPNDQITLAPAFQQSKGTPA
jgi:hypothetical protein